MSTFNVCRCFYVENYFVSSIRAHMRYENDGQFQCDYAEIPGKYGVSMTDILAEAKEEKRRRVDVVEGVKKRRAIIREKYIPIHPDLFELQERFFDLNFLSMCQSVIQGDKKPLLQYRVQQERYGLYQFPVFTDEFCQRFTEEIVNFRKTDLPRMRPNTMNYNGVILDEIGFTPFFDALRSKYLNPVSMAVFPEWTGTGLDSHRAFTVSYDTNMSNQTDTRPQVDLTAHYDNAEVTLNVALNSDYEGGEIHFGNIRTGKDSVQLVNTQDAVVVHKRGWGILHRGRQLHGALAIEEGRRDNMIIWMRASSMRNQICPMCWNVPDCVPVSDGCYGDGFTEAR